MSFKFVYKAQIIGAWPNKNLSIYHGIGYVWINDNNYMTYTSAAHFIKLQGTKTCRPNQIHIGLQ